MTLSRFNDTRLRIEKILKLILSFNRPAVSGFVSSEHRSYKLLDMDFEERF